MLGVLADTANKTAADIGEFFEAAFCEVDAVDLAGFATGIGIAVTAPCDAFGVIESVAVAANIR